MARSAPRRRMSLRWSFVSRFAPVFSFGSDEWRVVACLVDDGGGGGWLENDDGDRGEVGRGRRGVMELARWGSAGESGEVGSISALRTSRITRTDWTRFSWITYRHADRSL